MKKIFTPGFLFATALIIVAVATRLMPHPANFTPVIAIALFGAAYFKQKQVAFLLPMAIMFISDLVLGFYSGIWAVYLAFVIAGFIGLTLRNKVKPGRVLVAALASSIVFFVISNFGVWMSGLCGYPMNVAGLALCYEMALPFFRMEILGTLVYSTVLFCTYELVKARKPALSI